MYTSNVLFLLVSLFGLLIRIFFWEEGRHMVNFLKSLKATGLDNLKGSISLDNI